jgi:hypothetical protein
MSMLNDHDRHLLKDLERQLQQHDPAWVRQFKNPKPPRQARQDLRLGVELAVFGHSGDHPIGSTCPTNLAQHNRHRGTL